MSGLGLNHGPAREVLEYVAAIERLLHHEPGALALLGYVEWARGFSDGIYHRESRRRIPSDANRAARRAARKRQRQGRKAARA
jgi:hypothetical protein